MGSPVLGNPAFVEVGYWGAGRPVVAPGANGAGGRKVPEQR